MSLRRASDWVAGHSSARSARTLKMPAISQMVASCKAISGQEEQVKEDSRSLKIVAEQPAHLKQVPVQPALHPARCQEEQANQHPWGNDVEDVQRYAPLTSAAMRTSALKSATLSEAPPTSAPSMSGWLM